MTHLAGAMFRGEGLLALWNGIEPGRAPEYDLWHTREHLPERLQVPGMLSARRYIDGKGGLPRYLTLYDVTDTGVFLSRPYRDLLDEPTEWSRSMRPSFRGFFRVACRPVGRLGGGLGGALLATTLTSQAGAACLPEHDVNEMLRPALAIPAVTAVHLAMAVPEVPPVPFAIGGPSPDYPRDVVLALEGYDRVALEAASDAVEAWRTSTLLSRSPTIWTSYTLGCMVDRPALDDLVAVARPAAQGPRPARRAM